MNKKDKKIGIVVMFRIDEGGGAPRIIVDLIKDLNLLGWKVFLFNPFKLNFQKIKEMYGPIKIEKAYNVGNLKRLFCKNSLLGRKVIKKEFLKMVNEVDKVIDIDGGIIHNYLPKDFDKSRYFVWRFAAIETKSIKNVKKMKSLNRKIKDFIKKILGLEQSKTKNALSKKYKIYPIDEWTKRRLIERWNFSPEEPLIHSIHTEEHLYTGPKNKDQIAVLARLAPNKMIEDSIKVFYLGTKKYPNYKMVIFGGATSDSKNYLKFLNDLIKKLNIQDRVKIIQSPSSKKCIELLQESKVFIDSQRDISLTMGPVEAMAAGCIILTHKSGGTYQETLQYGKFGFGFETLEEGGRELEKILDKLKKGEIDNKKSIKRADFVSEKSFMKRLKEVLEE